MTNAVFMPYVLVANRDAIEARIARLAAYCGLDAELRCVPPRGDRRCARSSTCRTRSRTSRSTARSATLIGDMAIVDPTAGGNPVKLTKALALDIFDRAMEGRV